MYDEIPAKQMIKVQFINNPSYQSGDGGNGNESPTQCETKASRQKFISQDMNPMMSEKGQSESEVNNSFNCSLNDDSSSSLDYSEEYSP